MSDNDQILRKLREASKEYENYSLSMSDALFLSHSKSEETRFISRSDADISTVFKYRPADKGTTTSSSEMLS